MKFPIIIFILLFIVVTKINCDTSKDKEECTESLVGLATCLPYVSGDATSPTADCCDGLKQVLKGNKKCLCLLIKDRNDPSLGLKINVTLALDLPDVCHAPANISQCPALLHLPPKSADAQVFYQLGHATAPANAPILSGTRGVGPASAPQKSDAHHYIIERRLLLDLKTIVQLIGLIIISLWACGI